MSDVLSSAAVIAAIVLSPLGTSDVTTDVAGTAGESVPAGILAFEILDGNDDTPVAGRLTFVGSGEPGTLLFPNTAAAPETLAVRDDVIYSLPGRGRVTVPAGVYTVFASRGLEWSIDSTAIEIEAGKEVAWTARLAHEIDSRGWVSGDFHLHTLTYSGHGDSNLEERIISIVGEGLEFAVATDHNHHTDYGPTIEMLSAAAHLTSVVGNEISTPIGHFNAFPLHPTDEPIEHRLGDATALFGLVAEHGSPQGIDPVIQVNHPRWGGIDYFGQTGLDPVTGLPVRSVYSDGYDAIEVLNENVGWGYYDAEVHDVHVGSGRHWVLQDWFNLLNRGHRAAAVGNSDSHTVRSNLAGYPRNFVRSSTDDPAAIDPVEIAESIRRHAVFTTTGPFVEYSVDGQPQGGRVTATAPSVEVAVRVQAASWIDVDRVKVVLDGDVVDVIPVPPGRRPLRLDTTVPIAVADDGWLTLLVEGDDSLAPIAPDKGRPIRPLAVANPVWISVGEDAEWTSPWERARQQTHDDPLLAEGLYDDLPPSRRALIALAAGAGPPTARRLIARGLDDADRRVRLCAVRAAEQTADASFTVALDRILDDEASDAYLVTATARALMATDPGGGTTRIMTLLERFGGEPLRRYGDELGPSLPGEYVRDWMVAGYFPNGDGGEGSGLDTEWGPESVRGPSAVFRGKDGAEVRWRAATAQFDGYVSLLELDVDETAAANAVAYAQCWLEVTESRRVHYTLGTDDGCRLEVNGDLLYEDRTRHGASPMQQIGVMELQAGWNRVLIAVENGVGGFGLYFRVLDDDVTSSDRP